MRTALRSAVLAASAAVLGNASLPAFCTPLLRDTLLSLGLRADGDHC
jgi:hypothetical protein